MTEAAAVTCVKLCKGATYINILDSNNVIFSLVQNVIGDLKMLLFKADKPFSRGPAFLPQDIDLLIDFFLANYRINPHNNDTLKVCLNTQSHSLYHQVLVSSLHRIITQRRLPWWPQISILYNKSSELKAMFLETLNRVTQGYTAHTPLKIIPSITLKDKVYPKFKASGSEEGNFQRNLLLSIVRLIHADPMLMLNSQGKAAHEVQSSTLELINGLVSLVQNPSIQDVSHEAMEALLVLHQPEKIEMWNPEAPINTFWDLSSQVLFSMSQKLIQHLIVNYTDVLKWLRKILECRNQFLKRHREYANVGSQIAICRQAHIKLEVVLFMYLWSIDSEAVLVSMSSFSLLCEEADVRCGRDEMSTNILLPNYSVYEELAQLSSTLNTGRAVLQKRIMALLRKIETGNQGVLQAWDDTFINWESTTKLLSQFPKQKSDDVQQSDTFHRMGKRRASHHSTEHELEDQVNEWANMTGFLCALGGVCLQRKSPLRGGQDHQLHAKKSAVQVGMLPHGATCQDIQYCPVTQFLGQLLRLLVCPNEKFGAQIQKNVKELVAYEMSPALYPILFDEIKMIVEKFFDTQGQVIVNDTNTQFIEHIIFIMKNVLEAKTEGQPSENLGHTSIEQMMLAIVRYVRHLDTTVLTLHIKTKLCQLVDAMMKRRDDLCFSREMKFRNKLVEYLTDWVMGNSHQISPPGSGDATALTRDLDEACMHAVASLLHSLPLQSEESDRGDLMEAKSQLFLKYFTLFMNLLNDCSEGSGSSDQDKEPTGNRSKLQPNMNSLRNATIQAMSNLLSANIDSGLMHSIGLGYHKDLQTRAAFMEVLTKILQQGTEFDTLAENVLADRYDQLVQLVTMIGDKGELPIAMALANVVTNQQMDELARVFVTLFDAKHLLSPLLWNMFYREVDLSECMQTLFRGSSLGSKIMAFCFKIYGATYLQGLLEPLIQDLIDNADRETSTFEVNPIPIDAHEDIQINQRNLMIITQTVFDAIISSADRFPSQLRSMCHCLYQVLCKRFPNSQVIIDLIYFDKNVTIILGIKLFHTLLATFFKEK